MWMTIYLCVWACVSKCDPAIGNSCSRDSRFMIGSHGRSPYSDGSPFFSANQILLILWARVNNIRKHINVAVCACACLYVFLNVSVYDYVFISRLQYICVYCIYMYVRMCICVYVCVSCITNCEYIISLCD